MCHCNGGIGQERWTLVNNGSIWHSSRGKLCRKGTSKTGRAFYNLQYWHNGRNNVRYVGEADYPVYAEAVAGYREFMRLVEEYVDLMTGITEEMAIRAREAEDE